MLYVAIWYVSIRYEGEGRTAVCSSFTLITTGRIETYQIVTYSIRTLLKIDYWSAKHVELLNVMNKINHQILCILLDYGHIAKWYTVHTISNIKFVEVCFNIHSFLKEMISLVELSLFTSFHCTVEMTVREILQQKFIIGDLAK